MTALYSISEHVNVLTGKSVPDEAYIFFDRKIEEDADNFYAVRTYPSDGTEKETFPKSLWRQG